MRFSTAAGGLFFIHIEVVYSGRPVCRSVSHVGRSRYWSLASVAPAVVAAVLTGLRTTESIVDRALLARCRGALSMHSSMPLTGGGRSMLIADWTRPRRCCRGLETVGTAAGNAPRRCTGAPPPPPVIKQPALGRFDRPATAATPALLSCCQLRCGRFGGWYNSH